MAEQGSSSLHSGNQFNTFFSDPSMAFLILPAHTHKHTYTHTYIHTQREITQRALTGSRLSDTWPHSSHWAQFVSPQMSRAVMYACVRVWQRERERERSPSVSCISATHTTLSRASKHTNWSQIVGTKRSQGQADHQASWGPVECLCSVLTEQHSSATVFNVKPMVSNITHKMSSLISLILFVPVKAPTWAIIITRSVPSSPRLYGACFHSESPPHCVRVSF